MLVLIWDKVLKFQLKKLNSLHQRPMISRQPWNIFQVVCQEDVSPEFSRPLTTKPFHSLFCLRFVQVLNIHLWMDRDFPVD